MRFSNELNDDGEANPLAGNVRVSTPTAGENVIDQLGGNTRSIIFHLDDKRTVSVTLNAKLNVSIRPFASVVR